LKLQQLKTHFSLNLLFWVWVIGNDRGIFSVTLRS